MRLAHSDCMWQRRSYMSLRAAFYCSLPEYMVSFLMSDWKILFARLSTLARLRSVRACCKFSFLALSSAWKSTLVCNMRFPVGADKRVASGKCEAALAGGWKFKKVFGWGGFALKRFGTTSSIEIKSIKLTMLMVRVEFVPHISYSLLHTLGLIYVAF